jgi:hypothetical protein
MKKLHLFIILVTLGIFFLGCSDKDTDKDTKYNCKITGNVFVKIGDNNAYVQGIEVILTPKNNKMQYFVTVKTNDKGVFQFDEAYKGIEYKLTCSGKVKDVGDCYGETVYFTVSKDELIKKDIQLHPSEY